MSIKVKNSELDKETISVINELLDKDIDASIAFRLTRIIKELSSIVEDKVDSEKRILKKYMKKDEDGKPVLSKDKDGNIVEDSIELEDPDKFSESMRSLMSVENEIKHDKIKFEDLGLDKAKVSQILKIDFLLE